ncbi:MAG: YkgJ family cysteine cluster protein [Betaproteobacteria bacterium]
MEIDKLQESALQRIDACIEANPWMEADALTHQIKRIMFENASARSKLGKLIALSDATADALKPYVACKPGCAHCCRVPALIYEREAIQMAKASGRTMVRLQFRPREEVLSSATKFFGQPCPFLASHECSIYEQRPLVCRVHHSLGDDGIQCEKNLQQDIFIGVAQYDPDIIEMPYHSLVLTSKAREPWGNILEFFPAP